MRVKLKKASITNLKKVKRNNCHLVNSTEEFTIVEIIRASRIVEAKSKGIEYTGKTPTDREKKIIRRGDYSLTLRKLDERIIVKNRQENKPTNRARAIYKEMMSET